MMAFGVGRRPPAIRHLGHLGQSELGMASNKEAIIYGRVPSSNEGEDVLIFLPKSRTLAFSKAYAACEIAKTWGEFRQLCPASELEFIQDVIDEDVRDNTSDDDPFDPLTIPVYGDGTSPGWAKEEALETLPTNIIDRFGLIASTTLSNPQVEFRLEDEDAIVQDLAKSGYSCERDDELMRKACDYTTE